MWFGLWRYWSKAKVEFLTIAFLFGIACQTLAILIALVMPTLMERLDPIEASYIFALGEGNESGSLSPTALRNARLAEKIPSVKNVTSWYVDNVEVKIGQHLGRYRVAFTTAGYQKSIGTNLAEGHHSAVCNVSVCELQGALIGKKLARELSIANDATFIEIAERIIEIRAISQNDIITFPRGESADIVIDISYFSALSSFKPLINTIQGFLQETASAQQVANYLPIFSSVITLSNVNDRKAVESQLLELHQSNVASDSSPLANVFSLAGARNNHLQIIQGLYFDKQSKQADYITTMLILTATTVLLLTIKLNIFTVVARHTIRRAPERTLRRAIGASRIDILRNEFLFFQAPFLTGGLIGIVLLFFFWPVYQLMAKSMFVYVMLDQTDALHTYLLIALFLSLTAPFIFSANSAYIAGKQQVSRLLPRHTVRNNRAVTICQYMLGALMVGLSSLIFLSWLDLQSGNDEIDKASKLWVIDKTVSGDIQNQWVETWNKLSKTRVANEIALMSASPGNRNLASIDLTGADGLFCNKKLSAWENSFFGNPFDVIGAELLAGSLSSLSEGDIVVSQRVAKECGLSATEIINKILVDPEGQRYQVKAVVPNIQYNLKSKSPELVIYSKRQSPKGLYFVLFEKNVEFSQDLKDIEKFIEDKRLQLDVIFDGNLNDYFHSQLSRELTLANLTFFLCITTLIVLIFGFLQHVSRVILVRRQEWGVRKATGSNIRSLHLLIVKSLFADWLISNMVLIIILIYSIPDILGIFSSLSILQLSSSFVSASFILFIGSLLCASASTRLLMRPASQLLQDEEH